MDHGIPLNPDRLLLSLPYPRPEGFESITFPDFGPAGLQPARAAHGGASRPRDAEVTGYTLLMSDDFDGQGEPGESVIWKCPRDGSYYIGLILRDATAALEGPTCGRRARWAPLSEAARGPGGAPLHRTPGPPLQRADDWVATAKHSGPCASIAFACWPKPKVPPLAISNLTAWHLPDEPGERPGRG